MTQPLLLSGIRRGDPFTRVFRFLDKDRDPADVSDLSFEFVIAGSASTPVIRKELGEGLLLQSSTEILLRLTNAETRVLPLGRVARYELRCEDQAVLSGFLEVVDGLGGRS